MVFPLKLKGDMLTLRVPLRFVLRWFTSLSPKESFAVEVSGRSGSSLISCGLTMETGPLVLR